MKFDFSYAEYEKLKERCGFKDDELLIFQLKRQNYNNIYISVELGVSTKTIQRKLKIINNKISRELDNI